MHIDSLYFTSDVCAEYGLIMECFHEILYKMAAAVLLTTRGLGQRPSYRQAALLSVKLPAHYQFLALCYVVSFLFQGLHGRHKLRNAG